MTLDDDDETENKNITRPTWVVFLLEEGRSPPDTLFTFHHENTLYPGQLPNSVGRRFTTRQANIFTLYHEKIIIPHQLLNNA